MTDYMRQQNQKHYSINLIILCTLANKILGKKLLLITIYTIKFFNIISNIEERTTNLMSKENNP